MPEESEKPYRGVIQTLLSLAKNHKREFAIVSLFALLATAADLLQPLVYRRAINDVAGLFVEPSAIQQLIPARTPDETLKTLIESVALLFLISTTGYFSSLRSDYFGAKVASLMEANLIVTTFGHVLRLPTSYFARQASAGIARRIDQSDQLAPVVHAFSQQIAPEAIRLVGICAIMFTQNWEMALVSLHGPRLSLDRPPFRAPYEDRPRTLLRTLGKHLRPHHRRHRQRQNRQTLRR
ncbi:MAG: ABC transporter ATP-binding protein [Bryobacterales bacterium]|nr:ABC transporter ATP-binding protein [Bryobacterales bacterium]